jgi:phospholipid/cholesterol/gamma-HCH transport system substrate-binding protein
MREEARHILFGVATLIALAVLGAVTFGGKKIEAAASGYIVRASFNKIDGLNPGDAVRLAGIKIGEVAGMRLGDQYAAVVDLRIDSPVELPTDTSAAIHTDGLFGAKHVVLVPGAEDRMLKAGSAITLTQDSVVVGDLLDLIIGEGRAKQAKNAQSPPKGAPQGQPKGVPSDLMPPSLLNDPQPPR